MKNRRLQISLSVAVVAILLLAILLHIQLGTGMSRVKAASSGYARLTKLQKRWLSGVVNLELNPRNITTLGTRPTSYFPVNDDGCSQNLGSNIKVNQNCLNLSD